MNASFVAQVSNLLDRRFAIGRLPTVRVRAKWRTTRWLEAVRYGRWETCATAAPSASRPGAPRSLPAFAGTLCRFSILNSLAAGVSLAVFVTRSPAPPPLGYYQVSGAELTST